MSTIFTDSFDGSEIEIEVRPPAMGNRAGEIVIENKNTEVRINLLEGQLKYLANMLAVNGFEPDKDYPEDATHFANKTWWCHQPKHNRLDKWEHGCWKMQTGDIEKLKRFKDYRNV